MQLSLDIIKLYNKILDSGDFPEEWSIGVIEINTSKTKIMVIRKNKKRSKACKIWKFGDKEIKECNEYKNLGVTFKSNGSYSAHVDIIKQKAQKSYFAPLSKSNEWDGFNPGLFLFLFDSTILPILNYATDVWGFGTWECLEKIHLMACKSTLGVKGSTTSLGIYAELGRCSLLEHRHINILKFYIRLINLDSSRYAYRALQMLINDADSGVSNWVSIASSLMTLYRIHTTDNPTFVKSKVSSHFRSKIGKI